jgi:hypothetical protein
MAAAVAAEVGVLHAHDGMVIAGTPTGTVPFVRDFHSGKRQDARDEIQRSLQLRLQHLSRTDPWAAASPHLQQHAADLRQAILTLFDQPDPRTAGLNPTATSLQLHLLLREGGFGVSDFPPACAAAFISSATRAASALSAAAINMHPFSAPTSATSACWQFLHTHFPELCPSPAEGLTAATAAQLTWLPTQVRNALTAANRAELTRLWPAHRARALLHSIFSHPGSMLVDGEPYTPSLRLDD